MVLSGKSIYTRPIKKTRLPTKPEPKPCVPTHIKPEPRPPLNAEQLQSPSNEPPIKGYCTFSCLKNGRLQSSQLKTFYLAKRK